METVVYHCVSGSESPPTQAHHDEIGVAGRTYWCGIHHRLLVASAAHAAELNASVTTHYGMGRRDWEAAESVIEEWAPDRRDHPFININPWGSTVGSRDPYMGGGGR